MENINIILNNKEYKQALEKLSEYEKNREFCNHTIEHFIDVSRIAYIMVLEEKLSVSKEVIYAIGLLHDIGRVKQYEEGIHHDIASVEMSNHRKESDNKLEEIIYKADKLSRQCFNCKAEKECYWSSEKKNFKITY